jgi:hypothetical protein
MLLAAVGACVLIGIVLGLPLVQFSRYYKTFPKRHLEATQFIAAVYSHYGKTGRWPDAATASRLATLPSEWEYSEKTDAIDATSTPLLYLHGQYHMSLVYYFSPPAGEKVNREWIMSSEGDKTSFDADVDY